MEGISKLAKMLASDDIKKRRRGHQYVSELLSLKPGPDVCELSYTDVINICKGLYYSLWMQDKLLLQEDTVARIVNCLPRISTRETRVMYINAIFETLAREWENLDVWRTDKFMMLTRDFFTKALALTNKRAISIEALTAGVFDKVLNKDANSVVDLKTFFVSMLQQELVRRKPGPTVLHKFYQHTFDTVLAIPKGSAYSTHMTRFCLTLARLVRSHPQLPLQQMSEHALLLSTKIPVHKKTLSRLAQILFVKTSQIAQEHTAESMRANGDGEPSPENSTTKKDNSKTVSPVSTPETITGDTVIKPVAPSPLSSDSQRRERKRRRSSSDSLKESSSDTTSIEHDETAEKVVQNHSTPLTTSNQRKRKRRHSNTGSGEASLVETSDAPVTPNKDGAPATVSVSPSPSSDSKKNRRRRRSHSEEEASSTNSSLYVTASEEALLSTPIKADSSDQIEEPDKKRQKSCITSSEDTRVILNNGIAVATPDVEIKTEETSQQITPQTTPKSSRKNQKSGKSPIISALPPAVDKEQSPNTRNPPSLKDASEKTLSSEPPILATPIQKLSSEAVPASTGRERRHGEALVKLLNASLDSTLIQTAKKRVSFGKVFRKKFSASKQLSFTPSVSEKPDRGILRQL